MTTLDLDPTRFRFEPTSEHERWVCYGRIMIMRQMFDDPDCELTRQRGIEATTSLLEYRWSRMSAHERLELLAALR